MWKAAVGAVLEAPFLRAILLLRSQDDVRNRIVKANGSQQAMTIRMGSRGDMPSSSVTIKPDRVKETSLHTGLSGRNDQNASPRKML